MPLFEVEASPRGRVRVFARAQLPFLLGVGFIALIVWLSYPPAAESWLVISAYVLTTLASAAAIALPWERHNPAWMLSIAVIDIVAVAFIRAELISVIPAAGMLAIFPVLWLAYGFAWYGMLIAVFGAGFITSFTFVYSGVWPETPLDWVNVVTLPTLIIGVAVIVYLAANHLRRNARRLVAANAQQASALREALDSQLLARSILNTVNAGVAFYDSSKQLVIANTLANQMTQMVGFRLDEPPYAGDDVRAADRVSHIPYSEQIIPRALRGEVIDDHLEWLGPPEKQVAIIASSRRVHREDGMLLGTVIVAYDVTELVAAVDIREQFLRTVSHELRTPMTSITGFVDLIEDALDPNETKLREYLAVVSRKTQDLTERIGELLAATDTDQPLQPRTVDLDAVAAAAVASVGELAGSRGITIERLGPPNAFVRVDERRMRGAIHELVTNAVKFGMPHSPVTVAHDVREGRASIAVTNRGQGVTPGEQVRLFDKFYRTPFARAQAIQGFGLGLTVARDVVSAHGGHIALESIPGETTTFTIEFPVG